MKQTNLTNILLIFFTLSYIFLIFLISNPKQSYENVCGDEVVYVLESKLEFSPQNLELYLNNLNIRFPHIVYAQAIHETGNFTSSLFVENFNLFGMKLARSRPTTARGVKRGFAYYRNWQESALDYALFQTSFTRHIKTEEEYIDFLNRVYAEDESYAQLINNVVFSKNLNLLFNF
jgi:uncharacterized FlgJ-related protein